MKSKKFNKKSMRQLLDDVLQHLWLCITRDLLGERKMKSHSQLLHDGLERLLAPLEVSLTWTDAAASLYAFATWWLCSKQDPSRLASMETVGGVDILDYSKLDALCDDLCSEISKILVDDHYVLNPYLDCRSLEEM